MSGSEATQTLHLCDPGTFLLRDSSSQTSYFTVSFVNNEREVKHLRVLYSFGEFYFDGVGAGGVSAKTKSNSVLGLVALYWSQGALLQTPYKKRVGTLKELSRIAVNREDFVGGTAECKVVQPFLNLYPFKI